MLTTEQKTQRLFGIGASEVAAVCGLNPWRGPHDVWLSKVHPSDEPLDGAALRRGNIKEPMLVDWYKAETGATVRLHGRHQRTVVHPEHPLVMATPDGYVDPGQGLLECKAPGRHTIKHWGEKDASGIPEYYVPQGQWQLAATGRKWVDYAVDLGDELGIYRMDADPELFESLLEITERFWWDHVFTKTPPPPDGSDGCSELLRKVHPRQLSALEEADQDVENLMAEFQAAKEQLGQAEARSKELANAIKARIGDKRGYQGSIGKVVWTETKGRTKTDWAAIAAELNVPEDIVQKHTRIGDSYRTLRTYWSKK